MYLRASRTEVLALERAMAFRGVVDAPIVNEVLGRCTHFRETERKFLQSRRKPVEEVGLRLVDEIVCSPVDDGHDAARLAVGDGRLVLAVGSVVWARLGLEAAALARLGGFTACQSRKPGPGPSQAEPSPSRGSSPGLGKCGTTVLET